MDEPQVAEVSCIVYVVGHVIVHVATKGVQWSGEGGGVVVVTIGGILKLLSMFEIEQGM